MMQININTDWEWYENTNVFRLCYHCLLHTNLEDKRYCGREIKAGQFVSSITRISAETGLTEWQVRTALKKLKDTGYISTKSTNKYTIYTINEYQKYIDCGQVAETTTEENTMVENGTKMEQPVERKMEQTDENAKKNCEKSKENCEKSNKKAINECFEKLWKQYPNKRGKGQVSDAKKKVLYQIGEEHIQRALEKDASWRKPQNGSTFFNSGYIDYLDENYEKPPEPKPQRNPASILECERDYDFDDLEQQLLEKQFGGNT